MKSTLHTLTLLLCASALSAQVSVKLGFNHNLGQDYVRNGLVGTTDMDQNFNLHRLQYYVSQIVITHDGGTQTPVEDTYILVDAFNPEITELGEFEMESIEAITFSIGVETPVNNADPAQWPAEHPLAPKWPSMHWGWTSGYRFVAMEGYSGDGLDKLFEIHALGNNNYFSTTVSTTAKSIDGNLVIALDADYTMALSKVNIANGPISHGDFPEGVSLLQNFRDKVFTSADGTVGADLGKTLEASLYPTPSTIGGTYIQIDEVNSGGYTVQVWNNLGQEVRHFENITSSSYFIPISQPGGYFITATTTDGARFKSKLIIQ